MQLMRLVLLMLFAYLLSFLLARLLISALIKCDGSNATSSTIRGAEQPSTQGGAGACLRQSSLGMRLA